MRKEKFKSISALFIKRQSEKKAWRRKFYSLYKFLIKLYLLFMILSKIKMKNLLFQMKISSMSPSKLWILKLLHSLGLYHFNINLCIWKLFLGKWNKKNKHFPFMSVTSILLEMKKKIKKHNGNSKTNEETSNMYVHMFGVSLRELLREI